jgi:hypothetical protein
MLTLNENDLRELMLEIDEYKLMHDGYKGDLRICPLCHGVEYYNRDDFTSTRCCCDY